MARQRCGRAALLTLLLALGGCKGWLGSGSPIFDAGNDGSDDSDSVPQAEGRWSGTTSSDTVRQTVDMIVLPGGYAYVMRFDTGYLYSSLGALQLTVDGSAVTSATGSHFVPRTAGFFERDGTVSARGSVSSGVSLNLTLDSVVGSTTVSTGLPLVFDSSWNSGGTLTRLSGNYVRTASDTGTQTLTIDSNGVITGASGLCTINGQASVYGSGRNLFMVNLRFGADCPYAGSMGGWAQIDELTGNKSGLTLFGRSAEGLDMFWFRGDAS